jgi:hypothetical protein
MAKLAHITPIRRSSRTPTASPHPEELLDAYSSWLFFERHFLHIGRFGVETAIGLIDTVHVNNAGAMFHLPIGSELPDYTAPSRRRLWFCPRLGWNFRARPCRYAKVATVTAVRGQLTLVSRFLEAQGARELARA